MRCAIIIVNYKTANLVADCLRSLNSTISFEEDRIIIVDNNSLDGSHHILNILIEKNHWTWVTVLPLPCNDGFAAGNNAGIHFLQQQNLRPKFIFFLNPDTIVETGTIDHLIQFMVLHPEAGIVGAQLYNALKEPESSSRKFPSVLSEFETGIRLGIVSKLLRRWRVALPITMDAHPCDWVSGAAMMIRQDVVEQVGTMDEGYFLYFEEVDYCRRAKNQGWQVWLEPHSRVIHLEGAATGVKNMQQRRGRYWYDSRRRYFIKHLGVLRWLLTDLLWTTGRLSLLARRAVGFGGDISGDPKCFMRDLLCSDLRALFLGQLDKSSYKPFRKDL